MSTLAEINSVAGDVIREFGQPATVVTGTGESFLVTVIRQDPVMRPELAGESIVTPREYVLALVEEYPLPHQDDTLTFQNDQSRKVGEVEPHSQRGYWRIYLEE